jgi:hypothetical protein
VFEFFEKNPISKEEITRIESLLPEIKQIRDQNLRRKVAEIWVRMWRQSKMERIEDFPYRPRGMKTRATVVEHTRSTVKNGIAIAKNMKDIHGFDINFDYVIAIGLLHEVEMLVSYRLEENGKWVRTELAENLPKKYIIQGLAREVGLPMEITYVLSMYSFHPPHVFLKPGQGILKYIEGMIFWWGDLASADILMVDSGQTSHLGKRSWFEL